VLSLSCSCLVSSSPSEVRQFNFECCPLAQEMCPASGSGLFSACSQPSLPFLCLFTECWFSSLPCPLSLVQFSVLPTPFTVGVSLQFCLIFSFFGGGNHSAQGLCWFMFLGVDRGVPHVVWCSPIHSVN
jgi:hypothetical protein